MDDVKLFVLEPDTMSRIVSSVTSPVSVSVRVLSSVLVSVRVKVDEEYMYDVGRDPVEVDGTVKKASSETEEPESEARPLPTLGGGDITTSLPSLGPLDTVTGELSPATRLRPNPRPGLASFRRLKAEANSSSRSVREAVRRIELLLLGAMTLGSPG